MVRYPLAAALALILSTSLAAQDVARDTIPSVPVVPPISIVATPPVVGAPSLEPFSPRQAVNLSSSALAVGAVRLVPQQGGRRSTAMMVVGGAGLLVGAVVGGDAGQIMMIGGGGLGLFGLWQYLK